MALIPAEPSLVANDLQLHFGMELWEFHRVIGHLRRDAGVPQPMNTIRARLPSVYALLALIAVGVLMAAPALAAEPGHKGPSEVVFIAQILALMIVGRLLGEAMQRLGQPAVMGQLIAGLLLGPSLFGLVLPELQHMLFPKNPEQKAMIDAISQFGILLLLLLTGMETDLKLCLL